MAYKVKGLFKGLKFISRIFAVKEHEMEIGYPTDVKHVAHIGWDSAAGNNASPSWMNEIMASSDFSSLGNFAASTGTSWVSQVGVLHAWVLQRLGPDAVQHQIQNKWVSTRTSSLRAAHRLPARLQGTPAGWTWLGAPSSTSTDESATPPPAATEAEAAVGVAANGTQ
ncbi:unnamed protein product [Urochloa decumbens]|uniref:CRIB domain-containing protein n=1 Tax=Urochloa decumbens TaxID=240449 RepID=A0ABC9CSS9_9POAL